jgi:hypothetical protein
MPGNGPYLFDRIAEFTSSTGTGSLALAGSIPGCFTFSSVLGDGLQTPYVLDDGVRNWVEWGMGTYHAGTNTWSRDSVEGGTFGTTPMNLLPGTKHLYMNAGSKYLAQLVAKQAAGTVLAGPSSGPDGVPSFKSLIGVLNPAGVTPVVTGDTGNNSALQNLLRALAILGLIVNASYPPSGGLVAGGTSGPPAVVFPQGSQGGLVAGASAVGAWGQSAAGGLVGGGAGVGAFGGSAAGGLVAGTVTSPAITFTQGSAGGVVAGGITNLSAFGGLRAGGTTTPAVTFSQGTSGGLVAGSTAPHA